MPTTPDKCTAPFLASEEAWMWQLGTQFDVEQFEQLNMDWVIEWTQDAKPYSITFHWHTPHDGGAEIQQIWRV